MFSSKKEGVLLTWSNILIKLSVRKKDQIFVLMFIWNENSIFGAFKLVKQQQQQQQQQQ